MAYLKEKQKVLDLFFEQYTNNNMPAFIMSPNDVIKMCLTVDKIHDKQKLDYEFIDSICHTLKQNGHITTFHHDEIDPHGINTFYVITAEGKKAHFENFYVSQISIRTKSFWISVIPIIISVVALAVAILKD